MIENNLWLDVSRKEIKSLTVNQGDKDSRTWRIHFSNGGTALDLHDITSISVFMQKPDNTYIFNPIIIDLDNNIGILTFTEQMCAASGTGALQLCMYTYDEIEVSLEILYTFSIKVIIAESSIPIDDITSSSEFQELNNLILKAQQNYDDVVDEVEAVRDEAKDYSNLSKSWAIGNTGVRDGEDTDNSKYYAEQAASHEDSVRQNAELAEKSAQNAKTSEDSAKTSETNAKTSEDNAKESETNAKTSEINAKTSENNAKSSEEASASSETNAKASEDNAKTSEGNAKDSETASDSSATAAALSESNAKTYKEDAETAKNNAEVAQEKASTAQKNAENANESAKKYEELCKNYAEICQNATALLEGGFIPCGTISFENLPAFADVKIGYMYNISNAFTSTDDFIDGAGINYPAGTNIYVAAYNGDEMKWDCLAGDLSTYLMKTDYTNDMGNSDLLTENKTIKGAINELYTGVDSKIDWLSIVNGKVCITYNKD